MQTATLIPKPRHRTALSPFLIGDRVHSVETIGRSAFDGEIIAVRGQYWIVLADDGSAWSRLTEELELVTTPAPAPSAP
jgi:hypothetical protein